MAVSQKVIITCAITGSGHTPSMSPYLPYTVEQVVEQGVAAAEAGAAVLHLHARDPGDGRPTADPAVFAKYARGISDRCDVVISISTGGGTGMTVQERLEGVLKLKPELCTLNLGTMNYGSFPMIDRYKGQLPLRVGRAVPGEHQSRAVREYLRGHRAHAQGRRAADRHPVRGRGL